MGLFLVDVHSVEERLSTDFFKDKIIPSRRVGVGREKII